jgi:polar amino acid transport system substrate-binding protein
MSKFRPRVVLAGLAVLAIVGVACSNGSSTSSAAAPSGGTGAGVCASTDTSTGDALATVCSSGTLRVATDPKYKPQSWYDVQTSTWNGFDVDVANEIASRLGVTTDIQAQKWAVITAGSWNDRWDVSVGSMTDTVPREDLFTFTPAYYYTPAGIAVYKDNTSITGRPTTGKTVRVGVSTTYQDYVRVTRPRRAAPPFKFEINDGNLQTFDTDTDALDNLALGDGVRCDAAISAQQTIQAFIDDGGPIKLVGDSLYYETLAIAFDKNDPANAQSLSEAVSQIVDYMYADGTLSELSKKWYGGVDWTTASAGPPRRAHLPDTDGSVSALRRRGRREISPPVAGAVGTAASQISAVRIVGRAAPGRPHLLFLPILVFTTKEDIPPADIAMFGLMGGPGRWRHALRRQALDVVGRGGRHRDVQCLRCPSGVSSSRGKATSRRPSPWWRSSCCCSASPPPVTRRRSRSRARGCRSA